MKKIHFCDENSRYRTNRYNQQHSSIAIIGNSSKKKKFYVEFKQTHNYNVSSQKNNENNLKLLLHLLKKIVGATHKIVLSEV